MHNTHKTTPGGNQSAQHEGNTTSHNDVMNADDPVASDQLMEGMDTTEDSLSYSYVMNNTTSIAPSIWMEHLDIDTLKKCRWRPEGFWYLTPEDLDCGLSFFDFDCEPYDIGRYAFKTLGTLRVAWIKGIPWVSLRDTCCLTGLADSQIGVDQWSGEQFHVRAIPGHLEYDGVRYIHGCFMDSAIRLEAVPGVMRRHNLREDLVKWVEGLVQTSDHVGDSSQSLSPETSDGISRHDIKLPDGGVFTVYCRCSESHGGVFAFCSGMWNWVDLNAVVHRTGYDVGVVKSIAGPRRKVSIPEFRQISPRAGKEAATFVRSDVVDALTDGRVREPNTGYPWGGITSIGLSNLVPKPETTIPVSLLKRMLGDDALGTVPGTVDGHLPIDRARRVALATDGFAGWVTAILLTDGGFRHGGELGETPVETLTRFRGLIPNEHGRVVLRKVWEFMNLAEPFGEWLSANLEWGFGESPIINGTVHSTAYCCSRILEWEAPPGWGGMFPRWLRI